MVGVGIGMNDSFSGKNGKVKVMYVRGDDNKDDKSHKRSDKSRPTNKNANRGDKVPRWGDSNRPRQPVRSENEKPPRSVWQARLQDIGEPEVFDHGGISGKSQIDPAQLRKQREEETKVYGENACKALFQSRPDAIVRAYFIQSVTPRFREALRWMASNRKAYHVVEEEELAKVSGTDHHGGICFLIKKRGGLTVADYLAKVLKIDCVVAMENVGNPHNLGGMMRSCAHFGVKGVLLRDPAMLESGAAIRTAEGGAEHLAAIGIDNFPDALDAFRCAGYTIITTSSHKGIPLAKATLPAKTVLVLGEERDGLSDTAMEKSDMSISIGGTGNVESLNVSVATGILLAEWWRQNSAK